MKTILLLLFIGGANLILGQNNKNISNTIDSLKKCKDSLNNQLKETESVILDINTVYSRWKSNNNIDVFYYVKTNCSVSDGSQRFHIDTNHILNIEKGTRVIVVKITPDAYKFIYNGKQFFVQKNYLTPEKDYLQTENVKTLVKVKDSLKHQITEIEAKFNELNKKRIHRYNEIRIGEPYYLNKTSNVPRSRKGPSLGKKSSTTITKGTKVKVINREYKSFDSYIILYDEKKYLIRAGNLIPEQAFILDNETNNLLLKKDSVNQQLTETETKLADLGIGNFYYLKKDCGARLSYQYTNDGDNVFDIPAGTKVRVLSEPYGAYEISLNGASYYIKPGCLLSEIDYVLKSTAQKKRILKDSLLLQIKEAETLLADFDYGDIYYFNSECSVSTGSIGYYSGGGKGDYVMDVPKGTKVVVLSSGYNSYEIALNGKRYWVNSGCLVPEKRYLSELHEKRELQLKDSLSYANPTLHYFKKDGWICDSLTGHMGFCAGDAINVKKGTKVYFVKNISTGYPRCIVYYNDKIYYTAPAFLVSEKSILDKKRREKEQEEKTLEQKKQRQESQQARLISLEKKFGSIIAYDIINGRIWIGMTDEMATESIGKPRKVNRTVTQYGDTEQWVYSSGVYLYFTDGVLTSWQD